MLRTPLQDLVLQVLKLGLGGPRQFLGAAPQPPPTRAVDAALDALLAIGCVARVGGEEVAADADESGDVLGDEEWLHPQFVTNDWLYEATGLRFVIMNAYGPPPLGVDGTAFDGNGVPAKWEVRGREGERGRCRSARPPREAPLPPPHLPRPSIR